MNSPKILYVPSAGKRSLLIEYLIRNSERLGVDVKILKSTGEIRGMKADCIIVDDLVGGVDYE